MTTRRRPADIGDERGRAIILAGGREIRDARLARDLSLRSVGTAVGLSESQVSRIGRGLVGGVSVIDLARLHAVVGLELSMRAYPKGDAIRDAASVALVRDFCGVLHPSIGWSTEVALPRPGDLRAWDVVLRGAGWRAGVEAETGPRDAQALVRRVLAKQRDGEVDLVILVLRATTQARRFLREAGEVVRSAFPVASGPALERLARGDSPGANALVILPPHRR
jgi:transcriptional regulator with XRE-family HTH domain